ncbi:MAG: hypothetical protein V9G23_18980 [Giesbergeria sp.]
MLKIQVENASPQLAARIANSMTDGFIALNLERRMDSSSYAKTFLETQLGPDQGASWKNRSASSTITPVRAKTS